MSVYGWFKSKGPSGFGYNSTSEEVTDGLDLAGKTYLVTGCNSGLGQETVRVLAMRGAKVVGAARTVEKAQGALAGLAGDPVPVACELSEPESVRAAVATVSSAVGELDGIVANAGIMMLPKRTVKHGLDLQFLTNHVGHFLLVTGLVDRLAPSGRVVILSSGLHRTTYPEGIRLDDLDAAREYKAQQSYGQSKLANLLFARELAKRLPEGRTANALHPGVIATNLSRHMPKPVVLLFNSLGPILVLKSVPQGTATQLYVGTHPATASVTGEYFEDCNVAESSAHGADPALAKALWTRTEEIVAGL